MLTLGREARRFGRQRRHYRLDSKMKSWIGGDTTSCCQGRSRRLQALFGNLSRLFRLNVAPACSASLVLGGRPRLEMNSPLWIIPCHVDTWLTRHLLHSPFPHSLPSKLSSFPPGPRPLPLWCRSLSQAGPNRYYLSILLLLRRPSYDHCICDSHFLSSGARWVRFSIIPTLSHSFLETAATWSCRWLEGKAPTPTNYEQLQQLGLNKDQDERSFSFDRAVS